MSVNKETVDIIAKQAKLSFTDEEGKVMASDLNRILDFLSNIDSKNPIYDEESRLADKNNLRYVKNLSNNNGSSNITNLSDDSDLIKAEGLFNKKVSLDDNNLIRKDKVIGYENKEDLFRNVEQHEDGHIIVPKVLE